MLEGLGIGINSKETAILKQITNLGKAVISKFNDELSEEIGLNINGDLLNNIDNIKENTFSTNNERINLLNSNKNWINNIINNLKTQLDKELSLKPNSIFHKSIQDLNKTLENKGIGKSITLQFYPQKMTKDEMERIFAFVDRRYSQYMS